MLVKVILVDINAKMVKAWRATFEENPEVEIVEGSMLSMTASAWASPTNARGSMDGGLDLIVKNHLGHQIEKRLQQEIARVYHGLLPVGHAICVPTNQTIPQFLISTPTMVASSEDVSDTLNVALACAAAFQAVHMQNARQPASIRSIALPGLGAATGRVPVEICADLMWTGYDLFRRQEFTDFPAMRAALEERLGDLGPMKGATKAKGSGPGAATGAAPKPAAKDEDVDFDDADFDEEDE
jgi:O-acetyl-ADP-ribose deacetylase (regulator of RNase III)